MNANIRTSMSANRLTFGALLQLAICMGALSHCTPGSENVAESNASSTDANNVGVQHAGSSPNTPVASLPNAAGAQGSMTIASSTAPDLCLAVTGGNATTGTLVLRSCDATLSQRWVIVNGALQSAGGLCLTLDANAPVDASNAFVSSCDPNNLNQLMVWQGGRFSIATPTVNFVLQSDRAPPSSRSVVQFGPFDGKSAQQLWNLGQYSHDDAQKVIQGGTHIVPLDARTTCLTAGDTSVGTQPCNAVDPNQAWQLTDAGQWKNRSQCLQVGVGAPLMVPCLASDTKQLVSLSQGLAFSSTAGCLAGDANSSGGLTMVPCDFVSGRKWLVGLSQ